MAQKKPKESPVVTSKNSQPDSGSDAGSGAGAESFSVKDGSNVKVSVRVRPRITRELDQQAEVLVKMSGGSTTLRNPSPTELSSPSKSSKHNDHEKQFHFDHSLYSIDPQAPNFVSQKDTYDIIGKEILDHTLSGYNTCIFAYGQTGSGKSYTMMGDDEDPGIIPRSCADLFARIDRVHERIDQMDTATKVQVRISYFEIYNEQVKDLLDHNKQLKIRENPKTGPYVEGLSEFNIESLDDFNKYMSLGNNNRTVAATKMNYQSSRSHAVFTISLRITEFNTDEDLIKETNSSLRLVDLAGSERADSTGTSGVRFKEGSNINKSLTTLGRVISSLSDGSSRHPFRDSTLTWILKESLGGNSKTAMIACISPCDYDETLSTLRYATIAKKVKLNAVVNVDEIKNNDEDYAKMKQEIEELKNSLNEAQRQEGMITQITNMSKFFEDRLIDQTNKYNILKEKLNHSSEEKLRLQNTLNSLLVRIIPDKSTLATLRELGVQHDTLKQRGQVLQQAIAQELELFAP